MTELPKPTLNTLLNFIPNNEIERRLFNNLNKKVLTSYFDNTKRNYCIGMFYLGGQVKMNLDEEITIDKIKEVREIGKQREIEYGGPCNSFEAASIYNHKNLLGQMEEIINAYTKIMYLRGLEKTKLNDDVSLNIVSYCI